MNQEVFDHPHNVISQLAVCGRAPDKKDSGGNEFEPHARAIRLLRKGLTLPALNVARRRYISDPSEVNLRAELVSNPTSLKCGLTEVHF